ncbi:MAG: methyltransferase domain-containing protein [Promethearchaeota archaeon]|nr:MAG: methyltransferase domain-containing protein [Candidatus Lokiarchaeota archaeon]
MAVTYMQKLEQEPESYDEKFTLLTDGINNEVKNWVLDKVGSNHSILEVGCGTGSLASKMALKGNKVIAIDSEFQMINYAMKNYPNKRNIELNYQIGSAKKLPVDTNSQDKIISTFMLSELGPLEQQIFLRNAWESLKSGGRLIIAAEFVPSGLRKGTFKIKRWRYKKKLKRLKIEQTNPLKHFYDYLAPIGFKIINERYWNHRSIRVLELKKEEKKVTPGYYKPDSIKFKGIGSQLKVLRCLLTGQLDNVPIEPGIYKSGNPDKNSSIIVTANYLYTYIKLMRNIENVDAWVLVVNSNGINVWCAARGDDFGNSQLIDAVKATGIHQNTSSRELILPQLAAGGVSKPELPENTEEFPFRVKYGPVWSKDLKEYFNSEPKKKPKRMKRAKFTLLHRIRAGITHTTFLLRKIFLIPFFILFFTLALLDYVNIINKFWMVGDLFIWILFPNLLLTFFYPIANFTRKFIIKSILFGAVNTIILGFTTWLLRGILLFTCLNLMFLFWIGFFTTMSFSGYTMRTNPREIQNEYKLFKKINYFLLPSALILTFLSIIFT